MILLSCINNLTRLYATTRLLKLNSFHSMATITLIKSSLLRSAHFSFVQQPFGPYALLLPACSRPDARAMFPLRCGFGSAEYSHRAGGVDKSTQRDMWPSERYSKG